MSAFVAAMDTQISKISTENGAPCLDKTGTALVDLFFKTVRDLDAASLESLFRAALKEAVTPEAKADLVVLAFQTRYCRGGKGEKMQFYRMLLLLADNLGVEAVLVVLELVPEFGYYKDLLAIHAMKPAAKIADRCVSLFVDQLKADAAELEKAIDAKRTPQLSLAAKYAPRENGQFDKSAGLAAKFALAFAGGANKPKALRTYRKAVAKINAALATPEVLMAAGRFAEIKFSAVASKCLTTHRKAFLNEALKGKLTADQEATGNRHPESADRVAARKNLREALASKGVKGKQLQPHEIASKLMSGKAHRLSTAEKDVLDAQWASLRAGVVESLAKASELHDLEVLAAAAPMAAAEEGGALASVAALKAALPKSVDLGKLVALVDVSGSMGGQPMEVAIGMGILVSELSHATFKDRVLTFESNPSWVDLSGCGSIAQKVATVQHAGWGGSTDFAAACERILQAAEAAKLTPDEIPDLLVLSDMQFNEAGGFGGSDGYGGGYGRRRGGGSWETHYERLQRRFAEVGRAVCGQPYAAPRIIFWNLRASGVGFPVQADAPNTMMLAGFSPSLLKLVLTGAELGVDEEVEEVRLVDGKEVRVAVKRAGPTPLETLRKALDDAAYDAVRAKLAGLSEGPFAGYAFAREEEGFELVEEDGLGAGAMDTAAEEAVPVA